DRPLGGRIAHARVPVRRGLRRGAAARGAALRRARAGERRHRRGDLDSRDGRARGGARRLRGRDRLGPVDAERPAPAQPRRVARPRALRVRGRDVLARRARTNGRVVSRGRRCIRERVMATRMEGVRLRTTAVLGGLRTTAARLERVRPVYVVGAFVVAEWLATLGLALSVRHNRWFYYHGGDQVWFYTTSWLLKHGQLVPTHVGYGWSVLLMPLTLGGGPNLIQVLPAIVLIDVLLLMPVAMIATYGIGERIGGRLFGYWVLVVWLVLPFVGIKYTDTGFKQRYTELALPDSFGLTSLSDFPHMAMLAVAAYFCLRVVQRPAWADGLLAGLFAGFAIGIQPSSPPFA